MVRVQASFNISLSQYVHLLQSALLLNCLICFSLLLRFVLSPQVLHLIIFHPVPILCDDQYSIFPSYYVAQKQPPSQTPLPSTGIQIVSSRRTLGCNVSYFVPLVWVGFGPRYCSVFHEFVECEGFPRVCKIEYFGSS